MNLLKDKCLFSSNINQKILISRIYPEQIKNLKDSIMEYKYLCTYIIKKENYKGKYVS